MLNEVLPPGGGMVVNYGVEPRPLPGAGPVREPRSAAGSASSSVEETSRGEIARSIEATVECEGVEKPVCVAELVVLTVP